jgi:hypothetical protein
MEKSRLLGDEAAVENYRTIGREHIENALNVFDAEASAAYYAAAVSVQGCLQAF